MAGDKFLKYIPLNETALERDTMLEHTLLSWLPGKWRVATKEVTLDPPCIQRS